MLNLERLLARRPPVNIEFGLERIRALLGGLGHPERQFRAIHVAGTNGKGSVAATAESILRAAGWRTGLYTSPHLISFSERIVLDGRPADAELLDELAAELLPLAEAAGATFFESATALAFAAFARRGVEAAVVEVGLGGRLDATNVLDAGVAVITSIDLDHADYLGSDPAGIAREKAGIIAPGATVVLGAVSGAPRRELLRIGRDVGTGVVAFGEAFHAEEVRETNAGVAFTYTSVRRPEGLRLVSPLRGAHQAINVATALTAVDELCARERAAPRRQEIPAGVVARGVSDVRLPGRFQIERRADGVCVYDIAHNPAAAELLARQLRHEAESRVLPRPIVLLAAVLGDKDWRAVLGPLLEVTDDAVLTDAPSAPVERRWDLRAAAAELSESYELTVEPDFARALERARRLAGEGTVLVTGSCHTVGDAWRAGPA